MDPRRKRLLFRARHMGTNENDILFGAFAEENLSIFTSDQLDRFEKLLEVSDPDLFAWVTGAKDPPSGQDSDVLRLMRGFILKQARKERP